MSNKAKTKEKPIPETATQEMYIQLNELCLYKEKLEKDFLKHEAKRKKHMLTLRWLKARDIKEKMDSIWSKTEQTQEQINNLMFDMSKNEIEANRVALRVIVNNDSSID